MTARLTLMKSQIEVGISRASRATSGRDVIRLGKRVQQNSFPYCVCVVERNFTLLETLIGGSRWFPELEQELWKKTRVMGRDVGSRPQTGLFHTPPWTASNGCVLPTD